jgi:hypothetical protein
VRSLVRLSRQAIILKMLYIIYSDPNLYKIGISASPERRLKQLQTGNGQKLHLYKVYKVKDEKVLEKRLHSMLWQNKAILGKSEWFRLCPETLEWLDQFLSEKNIL